MIERKTAWNRGDGLSLLILFLGISAFHIRGISPGRTFLAVDLSNNNLPWLRGSPQPLQNWLISDPVYQTYPFLVQAVESFQHGSWPLWNPHILIGHPSFADPLAQSFYPLFILLGCLLGPARGLAIGLWLHALMASFLTYGLLRTVGCGRIGALVGGFTYTLGGYMVNWFETAFWISTLTWLPGVLWCFELARRKRALHFLAAGGVAFSLALLGGQLAFAFTFALFFCLYAAGRWVESMLLARSGRWDIAGAAA
ncbi:MAG TPA: hypothetical protein VHS06_04725, partial [Chloroflexota bacterium]|nr:hypothetical protein [Chloroflexota bacterium]